MSVVRELGICSCPCHHHKGRSAVRHIIACCSQCFTCGKRIRRGFEHKCKSKALWGKINQLLDLIKSEGTTRTETTRQFILETTKEFPEFRELAMSVFLLQEGKQDKQQESDE